LKINLKKTANYYNIIYMIHPRCVRLQVY